MIIGIGCDMVNHSISEKKWNNNISRNRIFSTKELELSPTNSKKQISFLSGRFAAKEAVLKCFGTGMIDGISLKEIEVLKDDVERPVLILNGLAQKLAIKKGITNWHLTISHIGTMSVAFVIAEKL